LYSGLIADVVVFIITIFVMRHVMQTTLKET
jgi:hypothetical protein